jgi:hypothetical protein
LNGPWQFYWDELLTPEDLVAGAHTGATIAVPSSWVGQIIDPTVNGGQPLPRFGVATYRLQTAVPAVLAGKQLLLLLGNIGSAHRVWVMPIVGVLMGLANWATSQLQIVVHLSRSGCLVVSLLRR